MKNATIILLCILFIFAPAVAWSAPIDATSAGVEVLSPEKITLHNLFNLRESAYVYGVFRWSPFLNIWYPIGYGQENPTFRTQEYWPMDQGNTWTYQMSSGGSFTLTVDGAEDVCGQPSLRLLDTGGTVTYWINDDTGVSLTRYVNADGTYIEYCPAMKIALPQLYLGSHSLDAFFDALYRTPWGEVFASFNGWSQFTVKGMEDVTVPAGTFPNCMRATFNYSYNNPADNSFGMRTEEVWHAQGVGFVKRVKTEVYGWDGMVFFSDARVDSLVNYSVTQ